MTNPDPLQPVPSITVPATEPVPAVIYDRRRELRVKIRSLAQEARIIRSEENRCLRAARSMVYYARADLSLQERCAPQLLAERGHYIILRQHRIGDVRRESRYSLLAYAILRGRKWAQTERSAKAPDPVKLVEIVARFGWCGVVKAQAMVADFLKVEPVAP